MHRWSHPLVLHGTWAALCMQKPNWSKGVQFGATEFNRTNRLHQLICSSRIIWCATSVFKYKHHRRSIHVSCSFSYPIYTKHDKIMSLLKHCERLCSFKFSTCCFGVIFVSTVCAIASSKLWWMCVYTGIWWLLHSRCLAYPSWLDMTQT